MSPTSENDEPVPPPEGPARNTGLPLPVYRYIPGENRHPNKSPETHPLRFPLPNPDLERPLKERTEFLYGLDLFNHGYWWESHEAFEALWLELGRISPDAQFFQGLILLAGALIKDKTRQHAIARKMMDQARPKLFTGQEPPVPIEVGPLWEQVQDVLAGRRLAPPVITIKL